jgi:hypothetical protein
MRTVVRVPWRDCPVLSVLVVLLIGSVLLGGSAFGLDDDEECARIYEQEFGTPPPPGMEVICIQDEAPVPEDACPPDTIPTLGGCREEVYYDPGDGPHGGGGGGGGNSGAPTCTLEELDTKLDRAAEDYDNCIGDAGDDWGTVAVSTMVLGIPFEATGPAGLAAELAIGAV